jgi:hypothetical protein
MLLLSCAAGLIGGCAHQRIPAEAPPSEAVRDEPASTPAAGEVHCLLEVDRELVAPGENVDLAAELTPQQGSIYDIRMFVAAPDGSRIEVARWPAEYLQPGVTTRRSVQWAVEAGARTGVYGVALTISPQHGVAQETGNIASFRVATSSALPASAGRGVGVSGRHLVDGRGRVFVPRGPELVTAELVDVGEIDAIAATGANALRMLLTLDSANHMTPEAFDRLIGRAVEKKMVVWISLFTWDNSRDREIAPALGGGRLKQMSDYLVVWERQWLKQLVKKYDGWVVVDAMQEFKSSVKPPENPRAVREWVDAAKKHIRFFREQGFTQPLQIMTSFEGRDLHAIIANAEEILEADPVTRDNTKQTLFGWQAYWGPGFYEKWQGGLLIGRPITAAQAIKKFVATRNYPIMVGLDSVDVPGTESHKAIMPACAAHSVGWLWWEWGELKSEAHGKIVRTSKLGFAGAVRASD